MCVPQLFFPLLPSSLLTNTPPSAPSAQAAQTKHGILSGAADAYLNLKCAQVPATWSARGGRFSKFKAKKPDLTQSRIFQPAV